MIKKTLYFGNPAYLSTKDRQMVVKLSDISNNEASSETSKKESVKTIPIEDIGIVILDHSINGG